jgi:FkbM family methyltransferase
MIASKVKSIYERWPLMQTLAICSARVLKKIKIDVFEELFEEDKKYNQLLALGFQLKRTDKYIVVKKEDLKFSQALLRRRTSDIDVFIQIYVGDEFADLFSIIHDKQEIKTVIDAGANVGISSIKFNSVFPRVSIIAIEPDDENFLLLNKNLSVNNIKSSSIKSGIWNKKVKLYFNRSFRDGKEWSITVTEVPNNGRSIQSLSINDIVEEYKLEIIDILKIDIEGSEKKVFLESDSNLDFLNKTRFIAIEIHEEFVQKDKIEKILVANGFELKYSGEYLIGKNKHHLN